MCEVLLKPLKRLLVKIMGSVTHDLSRGLIEGKYVVNCFNSLFFLFLFYTMNINKLN